MIKIEDWYYIEKNRLLELEKQLNDYLKIVDLNLITLNAGLKEEIVHYCNITEHTVKILLEQYFNQFQNEHTLTMPFFSLCAKIIQQPIYILDAIEKFSYSLNNEQLIFYRHDFIHSKIKFAKDKFIGFNISLERLFNQNLAQSNNKNELLNVFLFTEQFINELKFYVPPGLNYFESPLFISFFKSIINYKKRYISVYGNFDYGNITEIENIIKNSNIEISKRYIKGFQNSLSKTPIIIPSFKDLFNDADYHNYLLTCLQQRSIIEQNDKKNEYIWVKPHKLLSEFYSKLKTCYRLKQNIKSQDCARSFCKFFNIEYSLTIQKYFQPREIEIYKTRFTGKFSFIVRYNN